MKVKDVMTRAVATCQPFDKLLDAASILERENVGCLPVITDDGSERVLGVLTDRDIAMAAGSERRPLAELRVKSAMTATVLSRDANGSLREALTCMHVTGSRRLPIVDRCGRLVGLVTLSDLTLSVARSTESEATWCREEICRILAAGTHAGKRAPSLAERVAAIDEIMVTDVVVARPDETLGAAARRMAASGAPCTPVLEAGSPRRVAAMLTDRDICLAAVRRGRPIDELPVEVAMSPVLRSCWPDDSPEAASAIMRAFGVRRLPVVDAAFDLMGLITLGDLAKTLLAKEPVPGETLPCDEIAETLSAIIRVAGDRSLRERARGDFPQRVED